MELNNPEILRQVEACSDLYERALAENDVQILDDLFWNGPQVVRYGVGENLYGPEEIAAFRRSRKGGSPPRRNLRRTITTIGHESAVVSLEFQREGSDRIGRQMQTWIRTDNGWKILAAHVSLMAARPETERPAL